MRFIRGWRSVRRPAGNGGGHFGVECFVPVNRILSLEYREDHGGWVAIMDFVNREGDLVVVKDIAIDKLVDSPGPDRIRIEGKTMFPMEPGADLMPKK